MQKSITDHYKALLDVAETEKQRQVVNLLLQGKSQREVASILGLSSHGTISGYVRRLVDRLDELETTTEEYTPKVLIIDIETSPTKAYVWRMWKENVGKNQVIEDSYIMSFAAKWLGEDDIVYEENRTEDDSKIVASMLDLLDEADYVVAHNGAKFDIPKINASAIQHGMTPPSPYKIIDTLHIARKHFKFQRNTLEYLADALGCAPKLDHAKFHGFELWKECLDGNEEAWREMECYNIQDVYTLEEVYLKLRPWHKETPNIGIGAEDEHPRCSKCGSTNVVQRGYVKTDVSKFSQWKCKDCGGWSRGRKNHYPKEIRGNLLTTVR